MLSPLEWLHIKKKTLENWVTRPRNRATDKKIKKQTENNMPVRIGGERGDEQRAAAASIADSGHKCVWIEEGQTWHRWRGSAGMRRNQARQDNSMDEWIL